MRSHNRDVTAVGKFIQKINLKNKENLFGTKGHCTIHPLKISFILQCDVQILYEGFTPQRNNKFIQSIIYISNILRSKIVLTSIINDDFNFLMMLNKRCKETRSHILNISMFTIFRKWLKILLHLRFDQIACNAWS